MAGVEYSPASASGSYWASVADMEQRIGRAFPVSFVATCRQLD